MSKYAVKIPIAAVGTAEIIAFVFRNMPVGVRAGIASMNQLDPHLDEASSTLNASSSQTFRNIILPLLKPAITASLVFSFVRAMTAISASLSSPLRIEKISSRQTKLKQTINKG